MPQLIELYRAGKLKLDEPVTRSFTLGQIDDALEALRGGEVARGMILETSHSQSNRFLPNDGLGP